MLKDEALPEAYMRRWRGMMPGTLGFLFETVEGAEAAVKPLVAARLIGADFELDTDLARYGAAPERAGEACVLRVHLEPGHSEALVTDLLQQGGGRPIAIPAEDGQQLSLEVERLRTERLWRAIRGEYVPMAVAAATTFHEVHGTPKAIVTRKDYDDALNIAAGALSSLVPVYALDPRGHRTAVAINLVTQRFALGATQLRSADGHVVDNLSVRRADLRFALSIVRRAGLPFSFALLAPRHQAQRDETP